MARQIFIVTAQVVDANGNHSIMQNYPKSFDSKNYQDDIDKTKRRAEGEFSEVWGAMCKNDTRQIQTVTLEDVTGFQLDRKSTGFFPAEQAEE